MFSPVLWAGLLALGTAEGRLAVAGTATLHCLSFTALATVDVLFGKNIDKTLEKSAVSGIIP